MLCSVGLVPGDASQGFAFQFGSISPGFMNGMQVLSYACELLMKILLFPIYLSAGRLYTMFLKVERLCSL